MDAIGKSLQRHDWQWPREFVVAESQLFQARQKADEHVVWEELISQSGRLGQTYFPAWFGRSGRKKLVMGWLCQKFSREWRSQHSFDLWSKQRAPTQPALLQPASRCLSCRGGQADLHIPAASHCK
eukprot:scaffold77566_cov19-Tisochrysis_lutea.AAC.2